MGLLPHQTLSVALVSWNHPYSTNVCLRHGFPEYVPLSMWRILQTVTCAIVRLYVAHYTVTCSSLLLRRLLQTVTCASVCVCVAHYTVTYSSFLRCRVILSAYAELALNYMQITLATVVSRSHYWFSALFLRFYAYCHVCRR